MTETLNTLPNLESVPYDTNLGVTSNPLHVVPPEIIESVEPEQPISASEVEASTRLLPSQEELQQDAEVQYMNTELLGKSFAVRRSIQEVGTQSIKVWQGLGAKVRNALDAPGKYERSHSAPQK